MIEIHPEHTIASACVNKHAQDDGTQIYVSTHALAETYAVLTRTPQWKISATQAREAIEILRSHLMVIALDEDDYTWSLDHVTSLGLLSGAIYDCLHARAALKVNATTLYTFNTKHFLRFGDDVSTLVTKP